MKRPAEADKETGRFRPPPAEGIETIKRALVGQPMRTDEMEETLLRKRLAPYKRIRRLEFAELPKTVSGKIQRAQLRELEAKRHAANEKVEIPMLLKGAEAAAHLWDDLATALRQ